MPERINNRRHIPVTGSTFLDGDGVAQGGADYADEEVSRPPDQPDEEPLPGRESPLRPGFSGGLRGNGGGAFHTPIVTCLAGPGDGGRSVQGGSSLGRGPSVLQRFVKQQSPQPEAVVVVDVDDFEGHVVAVGFTHQHPGTQVA